MGLLERAKNSETFPAAAVNELFSLYSLLSSESSNVQSVLRFISLLLPLQKNTISCDESLFLSSLSEVLLGSLKEPERVFLLDGGTIEPETSESFEGIHKGFSFPGWLYLESNGPDYQPTLLCVDYDTVIITFTVSSSVLLLREDDFMTESTVKLFDGLICHKWHFITVSVLFGDRHNMAEFVLNCSQRELMAFPHFDAEITDVCKVTFGGGEFGSVQLPSKLASCGLFPLLTNDKQAAVFEAGTRLLPKHKSCRFFKDFADTDFHKFIDVLFSNVELIRFFRYLL
jgi:hypothetical protein